MPYSLWLPTPLLVSGVIVVRPSQRKSHITDIMIQSYLGVLRLTCEASDVVSSIGRDYMKVMLQSISRRQYLSVIKFERYEVRTANN